MITPKELELFQHCPAKWQLAKTNQVSLGEPPNDYVRALKRIIYRMYAWKMSNNKPMPKESVRNYWDKNWKTESADEHEVARNLDQAAKGWLVLEKFWWEFYTERNYTPIGVNYEFSHDFNGLHIRVHSDLTLVDEDDNIVFVEICEPKTEWEIFTSLATKAEVLAFTEKIDKPTTKIFLELNKDSNEIKVKEFKVTTDYIGKAEASLIPVAVATRHGGIYASPSSDCKDCPFRGQCWV